MFSRPVFADFPDVAPLVSSLRRTDSGEAICERSSSSGSKPIPISLKTDLRRRLGGGVVVKDLLNGSPTDTGGSLGLPILIMMTYAEAIDDELESLGVRLQGGIVLIPGSDCRGTVNPVTPISMNSANRLELGFESIVER